MREYVSRKKQTTTDFSIPSLKYPTPRFGLESSAISRQAVPEIQPLDKPVTHDISRILLRSQAKLSISQPGDIYEQEADSVAQQVMQTMAQPVNHQPIQREALPEDEEELQMKPMVQCQAEAGMGAAPDLEASINQARGGGQAIADNIREPMEQAFGADFSEVKVHTDGQSDQLNRSIQARAFTTGQDVFFRSGEYNPGSRDGQELLAHELTHVVQQEAKATQRTDAKGEFSECGSLPKYSEQSRVLQRKGVGGNKIGFKRINDKENKEAWEKLQFCWQEAKKTRKLAKTEIEKTLPDREGKGGFPAYYANKLDEIKDERELLVEALTKNSKEPIVKIQDNQILLVTVGEGKENKDVVIGELIDTQEELYEGKGIASSTMREIYKKKNALEEGSETGENGEKEYIKDARGVYTRRYAYHEMNYHQMMDFVMSGELTGRYQMFMSAGEADNTSPQKIAHLENRKGVSKRNNRNKSDLTWEEVAVLHQWKGSGPYQSGVSLTSTSREQVRSNKGALFKTRGGFRLKIDLAKVAAEVPIVNDYAKGGVSQNPEKTTQIRPKGKYEFPESTTKSRELYIERVKKEWVIEVVHHGASDVSTTFLEIEKAVQGDTEASKSVTDIGIQSYLKGFEKGMKGESYDDGKEAGKDGAKAGKNVLAGYNRGIKAREDKGNLAQPYEAITEQNGYEEQKGGVPKEHKYDAHKVGYMWGRCTTNAMFASVAQYGAAIKGRNKV
ncbi:MULTISPECIES: eCIS core domain-containing protein [Nostoc]|uniref:DUF4157 domain-containing protein n=2 Tax=Nostoc TaxID=1177 RepID=A0ABR8IGI4_9NOSO|nr:MULTISPECIES: DUF4157 domain-containing protein [Nostoc]MBD2564617.1 DUF4157 domain-containing protein [Nostoc linckia FACHB-391]MBD2650309.1 DUF4157 domain-containing protein [Nostoc foliaceum FACHB-393]